MRLLSALLLAETASALTDIEHKPFMRKNIDPIVSPGKYISHMHSFYGSDAIIKDLPTTAQLQKGSTFKTYYEEIDHAEILFPANFRAIAGNASARSQSDVDERITALTWWCDGNGPEDRNSRPRAPFPRQTCSAHLQAILRFPDCVNPDKVEEYAYAAQNGGRCPGKMKRMPSLRFSVRYDTRRAIPGGWKGVPPFKLACGENMLKAKGQTFMRIDGAHGNGKQYSQCKARDADPENGTSDYLKSLEMMHEHMKKKKERTWEA
ncbi:hypothetical protein N0V85_004101 [Neurospora sp. IMI 360204]|nr:hypothetical protein N0V85_004101 [Neurospora sp. IMI 360204]